MIDTELKNICDIVINENKKSDTFSKHIILASDNKNSKLIQYIKDLDKKVKAIIIVPSITNANELKKQINKQQKDKAFCITSKVSKTINELETKQILIVTQEHYLVNTHNDYMKKRTLVIIDESIELLKEHKVYNKDLRILKRIIDSKTKNKEKLSLSIKEELNLLKQFIFICNGIHLELSSTTKNKIFLVNDTKSIKSIELTKLKKLIKSADCLKLAFNKELDKSKEKEFKKELLNSLDSLEVFSNNWFYYYSSDLTLKNSSLNCIESKIPNKSVVIFSSTANTNHIYNLFSNSTIYENKTIQTKDILLNINKTIDINNIFTNPHNNANILLSNLEKNLKKDSKTLIVTNENFTSYLLNFKTTFSYEVVSFENIKNIKDLEQFNNVVIYSLPNKEQTSYINQHCLANSKLENIENLDIAHKLETSIIASKIIDIINHLKSESLTVYLTIGTNKQSNLSSDIQDYFTKIKVKNWSISNKQTNKIFKKISWTNSIVSYIKANLKSTEELTSVEVMKNVNTPKSTFNKLCAKEEFQKALKENKLELRLPSDSKRGKVFYNV